MILKMAAMDYPQLDTTFSFKWLLIDQNYDLLNHINLTLYNME